MENVDNNDEIEFTSANNIILKTNLGTFNGEWDFISNKELIQTVISFPIIGDVTSEWEILRLTNSDLWVKDEENVQHRYKAI